MGYLFVAVSAVGGGFTKPTLPVMEPSQNDVHFGNAQSDYCVFLITILQIIAKYFQGFA